ncbi:xylulokinase [Olsenella uli]|uniref:xylulokinase n=2 Tax=Olsenella uli TaxID=133926 RepID=UPI0028ECD88A|nr:FGGY family carbohydrate kinase [Olsenella uli]
MKRFIGIDLGTSSVKVVVTDRYGRVEHTATRGYELSEPVVQWREIDPMVWWHATAMATSEVMEHYADDEIAGVGVTGQMHTVVPLNVDEMPEGPAIMWNDQRTAHMVPRVRQTLEKVGEHYLARIVSTGSPAINLAWIKTEQPVTFSRIKTFVIGPDWIVKCLTGSIGTDWCEASTSSLFNFRQGTWSKVACESLGIPLSMLPEIQSASTIAGYVSSAAGRASGVPVGVPVVRGTGDNPASAIAAGCFVENAPVISLGTSGVLIYAVPDIICAERGKSVLFSEVPGDLLTLVQLSIQTCGSAVSWLVNDVLRCTSYNIEDAAVNDPTYDTGRLIFYPFLNGDKTMYGDSHVRGAFVGLSLDTSRSELQRAVMEGISMGLRQLVECADKSKSWGEVRVVGGGSRSDLWLRILSSVLDTRIVRLAGVEGASQGAAMIAASSVLGMKLDMLARRASRLSEVFVPDRKMVSLYDKKYGMFLQLHDTVGTLGVERRSHLGLD